MHLLVVSLIVILVKSTSATLTCLEWALWNPYAGAWCYFAPDSFNDAKNSTVGDLVEAGVEAEKDLIEWDIKHHPVTIAIDFVKDAINENVSTAAGIAESKVADYGGVSIGFAKETVNQGVAAVHLLNAFDWNDVGQCLIGGVGKKVRESTAFKLRKRIDTISKEDALAVVDKCRSDKIKRIFPDPVFNITGKDPNEKVGATISDIAGLFIPVGPEEKAGAKLASTGVRDLAIAGAEDTTRIRKWVAEGATAESFASEKEAQAVAKSMSEKKWVKENCLACPLAAAGAVAGGGTRLIPGSIATSKQKKRDNHLVRRGASISCCKKPGVVEEPYIPYDVPPRPADPFGVVYEPGEAASVSSEAGSVADEAGSVSNEAASVSNDVERAVTEASAITYDPGAILITEEQLAISPTYVTREITAADGVASIKKDLEDLSTAAIKFSPDMIKAFESSDDLFTKLRAAFEAGENDPLYKAMNPTSRDNGKRLMSINAAWKEHELLKPYQDFSKAVVEHGKDLVRKTNPKLTPEVSARLSGNVEYFYVAPTENAQLGVDTRGLHVDKPLASFSCADTPGLVVKNSRAGTYSRVPLEKNTMHFMKGAAWDFAEFVKQYPDGPPTWHTVFGEEMMTKGRVSFVTHVYDPFSYW